MTRASAFEKIVTDNVSGAQRITDETARFIVERFSRRGFTANESRRILAHMARCAIAAQPAMASVVNLFNHVFRSLDHPSAGDPAAAIVSQAARDFARGMADHAGKISAHVFALLGQGDVVMTHSASQAVRVGLQACWKRGKRFAVICTESRPLLEGAGLARSLAKTGIPTCLATDAQAFALLAGETKFRGKVRALLVGADAVCAAGIVNKTGTLGLAQAARAWSIAFYVLCGSEKFLPRAYPIRRAIREKPAREILSPPARGVTIINRTFDITPLSYLSGVVTEQGMLSRRQLARSLVQPPLHPLLAKIVREFFQTL